MRDTALHCPSEESNLMTKPLASVVDAIGSTPLTRLGCLQGPTDRDEAPSP